MKNMVFTILICVTFAVMVLGTFYFWLKANKILWKYRRNFPGAFTAISPDEKILIKRYLRNSRLFFFGGILIIILFYFVFGISGFFEK
ncbi:MAG: hypothetical protein WBC06_01190 [Chitinophagaceae bacterium]